MKDKLPLGASGWIDKVGWPRGNQGQIERDLAAYLPDILDRDDATVASRCEDMIRNYDPCISCATHFLKVKIDKQ